MGRLSTDNHIMGRIVVYTAIFNDYDWLKDPVVVSDGVDYICYTDSDHIKSDIWKIVKVNANGQSPSLLNRKIKLLYPYTELKDYDYSLYVDGSIMIKGDVNDFLGKYLPQNPILMNFRHPHNDCIYEEIRRCIQQGRGNPDKLLEQYARYEKEGVPAQYGLSDNKILLRDNHSEFGKQMMEEWYDQVLRYSGRDQVCLSYILFRHHLSYSFFEENIERNCYFENWPHNTVEWYIRYWRRFKWFCERHHLLGGLIRYVDDNVKPKVLARI